MPQERVDPHPASSARCLSPGAQSTMTTTADNGRPMSVNHPTHQGASDMAPDSVRLSACPVSVRLSACPVSVRLSACPASVRLSACPASVRCPSGCPAVRLNHFATIFLLSALCPVGTVTLSARYLVRSAKVKLKCPPVQPRGRTGGHWYKRTGGQPRSVVVREPGTPDR